ncbi:MAG TPA: hypothetical protein VIL35_08415 [Vicinamibacterales bacterium]
MSSSPLLECFQRGEVPRDVRMLAAAGALAPRADEQLALLVHLVSDSDSEVAATAAATIDALPAPAVAALIARPEVDDRVRGFFVARGIAPSAAPQADPATPLVDNAGEPEEGNDRVPLQSLPVPARLKLAMKGTREQRAVLIRDPNRVIAAAVLSSPKLTETEVEAFARMSNVSEEVLRIIAANRAWMRKQAVAAALVRNPKCPPNISVGLLPRMPQRDIKHLATDRNVPEALRLAARKVLQTQLARQSS